MRYKTITAIDAQDFTEKLNNHVEEGFLLDKFLIHPMSGWYIGVLIHRGEK
jgi:hypothetical protein